MSSVKTSLKRARAMLCSDLLSRKEPVVINLHPADRKNIQRAAELASMEFDEFCALTLHKAVRNVGVKQ